MVSCKDKVSFLRKNLSWEMQSKKMPKAETAKLSLLDRTRKFNGVGREP